MFVLAAAGGDHRRFERRVGGRIAIAGLLQLQRLVGEALGLVPVSELRVRARQIPGPLRGVPGGGDPGQGQRALVERNRAIGMPLHQMHVADVAEARLEAGHRSDPFLIVGRLLQITERLVEFADPVITDAEVRQAGS